MAERNSQVEILRTEQKQISVICNQTQSFSLNIIIFRLD
jgi:hypothetical protein